MNTTTLVAQLGSLFKEVIDAVSGIDERTFFFKERKEVWSISEELHHLTLTIYPVNGVFRNIAGSVEKYGRALSPSRSYEQFVAEYTATIAKVEWKSFMPFIPRQAGEEEGYATLHLQPDKGKLDQFYKITGESINGLRDKLQLPEGVTQAYIINLYREQAQMLTAQAGQLTDDELDGTLIPLPYMGLITLREILYLNLHHNGFHLGRMLEKRAVRTEKIDRSVICFSKEIG